MGVKKVRFNIDKLLEPYSEGGNEGHPVKRTLGTITSKLIVAHRLPPEAVGAAIFKVFHSMAYKGLEFKGNEKYGSKGRELFSCIKAQAVAITRNMTTDETISKIAAMTACTFADCRKRTRQLVPKTRRQRLKRWLTRSRDLLWFIKWTV